jgi:hypothetical protein
MFKQTRREVMDRMLRRSVDGKREIVARIALGTDGVIVRTGDGEEVVINNPGDTITLDRGRDMAVSRDLDITPDPAPRYGSSFTVNMNQVLRSGDSFTITYAPTQLSD